MNKVLFSKQSDEWSTPQDLFDFLNHIYHFTLDPCSTHDNAKCTKHYVLEDDGLLMDWSNEIVFLNPPYSDIYSWVLKATSTNCKCVMLLPVRTDTKWFHNLIYSNPLCNIQFLKGRLKFGDSKNSAPFPSMLVFYNF